MQNFCDAAIILRIHGDNILECERALRLIAEAFSATVELLPTALYCPCYKISSDESILFKVELLPGYGRWGVVFQDVLAIPLREAPDALITQLLPEKRQEKALMALEFCNALPAGNNAWQRNGRALAYAVIKVPYFYYAEIGGVELDHDRVIKSHRFPNPIVPFSYLTATTLFDSACLPVYTSSLSSSNENRDYFESVFGVEEGKLLVKQLIEKSDTSLTQTALLHKDLTLVRLLAAQRRRMDTLRGQQWDNLLDLQTVEAKLVWLAKAPNHIVWDKKVAKKVLVTETFRQLLAIIKEMEICISVGATNIPICLMPGDKRQEFARILSGLYKDALPTDFMRWIQTPPAPLIVVWICGFKPRGDDSRPDRGLLPLARMLFGWKAQVLSIVYGPARQEMWRTFVETPEQLAIQNGLWEAILNLGDAVLADSATSEDGPLTYYSSQGNVKHQKEAIFEMAMPITKFSEQDVDSALHLLFAHQKDHCIFEGMCNPPGGDWSGLSVLNFNTGEELRWTSLPRVSPNGKRPDHVIEFWSDENTPILLAIESKDHTAKFGRNVGQRLKRYVQQLIDTQPTISKQPGEDWEILQTNSVSMPDFTVLSAGATLWEETQTLRGSLDKWGFDIAFGLEFNLVEESTLLHICARGVARSLLTHIQQLSGQFGRYLEIQVH